MLPVLFNLREFRHVAIREHRRAAWEARQRSMRHWQFWFAIVFILFATAAGSFLAQHWFGDEPSGTIVAACGLLIGMAWYCRTLFRIGIPYYREILSQHEKNAT